MLKELTLFGEIDKVADSLALIKEYEPDDGYYIAFSGGKDSTVVLDLIRRAGVRHEVHCNLTSLEPPEVISFIRENYPNVIFHEPPLDAWQLIRKKMFPYTKQFRYCAQYLKIHNSDGRLVVTGMRRAESTARRNRQARERRYNDEFLNPILDWSESDIWDYIHNRNLPYCKLYDEGFSRIGCILCPFQTQAEREMHIRKFPAIVEKFKAAFADIIEARRLKGKPFTNFLTAEDMWQWWIDKRRQSKPSELSEPSLFPEMED